MAKKRASKPSATRRAAVSPNGRVPKGPTPRTAVRPRTRRVTAPVLAPGTNDSAPASVPPPSSSGLTQKDLVEFHAALLAKRAQLLGDVTALHSEATRANRQDASGDLSSMPIHMADIGTDNYEQEFTLGLIESERQILRAIDQALELMKRGTYGLCLATGKPIGRARLKAHPWATHCYEYELQLEKGLRRRL